MTKTSTTPGTRAPRTLAFFPGESNAYEGSDRELAHYALLCAATGQAHTPKGLTIVLTP